MRLEMAEISEILFELISDKYQNNFNVLEKLAQGSYGIVHKVQEKSSKNLYAIKSIWLKDPREIENSLREIGIIRKVKSVFTVEFISAWRGGDDDDFVFIQMELCRDNLKNILDKKADAFGRVKGERMNLLEFYVSIHLLKEVTECLNYLHSLTPPVMHRDFKPSNVLITDGQNGRFLKLCDFGFAKDYLKSSNTRDMGTGKYVAWENRESRKYNYQTDIFSLAVLALDLFEFKYKARQENIDCTELLRPYVGTIMEDKFKLMLETLAFCTTKSTPYKERPTCAEFLTKVNEWIIDKNVLLKDEEFQNNMQLFNGSLNEFFIKYLKIKHDIK